MTVHLMQVKPDGEESITSMFRDPEEIAFYNWIGGLEVACTGVVIFVHRLSEKGQDLCTIPAAHEQLVLRGSCAPRYCGCFTCGAQRAAIRDLTAWNITETAEKLAQEYLGKMRAMQEAQEQNELAK